MTWPILPLAMRVKRTGWPAIWLPLVLLWPVILLVFCVALPLGMILPTVRPSAFAALITTYRTLCALHGTSIELGIDTPNTWTFILY